MENSTSSALTQQSGKSLSSSPRDQSDWKLTQATHSLDDEQAGRVLQRANEILSMPGYYQNETDPQTRAANLQAYVRALLDLPFWAVMRGFDDWTRSGPARAPSPSDIRILAERNLKPITDEIARRKQLADMLAAEEAERQRKRVTPEQAASIMAAAGFTENRIAAIRRFPLSQSQIEASQKAEEFAAPGRHWSDDAQQDGTEWAALRAARAGNALMTPSGG